MESLILSLQYEAGDENGEVEGVVKPQYLPIWVFLQISHGDSCYKEKEFGLWESYETVVCRLSD